MIGAFEVINNMLPKTTIIPHSVDLVALDKIYEEQMILIEMGIVLQDDFDSIKPHIENLTSCERLINLVNTSIVDMEFLNLIDDKYSIYNFLDLTNEDFINLSEQGISEIVLESIGSKIKEGVIAIWNFIVKIIKGIWNFFASFFSSGSGDLKKEAKEVSETISEMPLEEKKEIILEDIAYLDALIARSWFYIDTIKNFKNSRKLFNTPAHETPTKEELLHLFKNISDDVKKHDPKVTEIEITTHENDKISVEIRPIKKSSTFDGSKPEHLSKLETIVGNFQVCKHAYGEEMRSLSNLKKSAEENIKKVETIGGDLDIDVTSLKEKAKMAHDLTTLVIPIYKKMIMDYHHSAALLKQIKHKVEEVKSEDKKEDKEITDRIKEDRKVESDLEPEDRGSKYPGKKKKKKK